MLTRRTMLAATAALASHPAFAADARPAADATAERPPPNPDFDRFVDAVKRQARAKGISADTLERAFANVRFNPKVVELDRHQPEFTMTWPVYRARLVSDTRVAKGRELYRANRPLIDAVAARYRVGAGVLMGIWGLESNYGKATGGFNVIEGLATLAYDPRRSAFFRSELFDALKILDHGDIEPERMTGSYAGAMGQTQFMPDSFLKFAVDYDGDGRRDIWNSLGDVFASTANYLAREGWRGDLPWGTPVVLPQGFDGRMTGRAIRKPVGEWERLGIRSSDGRSPGPAEAIAAVILPGGAGDEAFLAYWQNFNAIRRYNPSDFYCISVGLIGDLVTA